MLAELAVAVVAALPPVQSVCEAPGLDPRIVSYYPEGNPQYWAAARDARGVLFVARTQSVLEYDGRSYELHLLSNGSTARSLAVGPDGAVYVGGQDEIGRIEPRDGRRGHYVELTARVPEGEREFGDVWRAHPTGGGVLFQTYSHLILLTPEDHARVWRPEGAFGFSFAAGERIFVLDRGFGLKELVDGELRLLPGGDAFADGRIGGVFEVDGGRLLVATRNRGLWREEGGSFRKLDRPVGDLLADAGVYHGARLPDGTIALGTQRGGLVWIDAEGRCLGRFGRGDGLGSDQVSYVYPDRSGHVWAALGRGFARLRLPPDVRAYADREGVEGIPVDVLRRGDLLYAATSEGLFVASLPPDEAEAARGTAVPFRRVSGLTSLVLELVEVGDVILAASGVGLHEVRDGELRRLDEEMALALHRTRFDSTLVLVGRQDGVTLHRWEDGTLRRVGAVPGVDGMHRDFAEADGGVVWTGTQTGPLWRIPFDTVADTALAPRRVGHEEGMPTGRSYVAVVDGRLVAGTPHALWAYDPATGTVVPDSTFGADLAGGTTPTWISKIATGEDGSAWFLQEADPDVQVRVRHPETGRVDTVLSSRTVPGRMLFVVEPQAPDEVWIGSDEGLLRYDPTRVRPDPPAPTLLLRRVLAGGDSLVRPDATDELGVLRAPEAFPADRDGLRVEVALTRLDDPDRNEYRYWLEGEDEAWSAWTDESQKEYTNLPPGEYALRVQGRDADGRTSAERAFAFRVLPPWYRTIPAYGAYLLLLAGLVVGGHRWRVRHLEKRQRRLETLVHERTVELRRSEQEYRDLFENSNDIVFTLDGEGRIRSINQAVERLLGRDREALVGASVEALLARPDGDGGRILDRALRRGEGERAELELGTADGEARDFEIGVRPFTHRDGTEGLEAVARDVTGRKELERRLIETRKMEAVGELAAGVAHDFNNILTVVSGFAGMLRDDVDEPELRGSAQEILDAADKGRDLVDQLLAFGRRRVLRPRPFDLDDLVRGSAELLRRAIGEDIRLDIELSGDLPLVEADPAGVRQILANLVVNAREAMPRGGTIVVATRVVTRTMTELSGEKAGGSDPGLSGREEGEPETYVALSVSDTGVGMTESTMERAFEPFFTTKERGEAGRGAGLGLAAVYGNARQSGGDVTVRSEPGLGSTFTVFLPVAAEGTDVGRPDCASGTSGEAIDGMAGATRARSGRRTVLVVGEAGEERGAIRRAVEEGGHDVLVAATGPEAVAVATAHAGPIDVLVTDVATGGGDTADMVRRLTALRPEMDTVFLTGSDERTLEARGIDPRSPAVLRKPIDPGALLARIDGMRAAPAG